MTEKKQDMKKNKSSSKENSVIEIKPSYTGQKVSELELKVSDIERENSDLEMEVSEMKKEIEYLVDLSLDLLLREYMLYRSKATLTDIFKEVDIEKYKKEKLQCDTIYNKVQTHLTLVGNLQDKYNVTQTIENLENKPPKKKRYESYLY